MISTSQTYSLLILFFLSLAGIIFMVWKKKMMLQNGKVVSEEIFPAEGNAEHLEKLKDFALVNLKKYGHLALVVMVRSYLLANSFLKTKYEEIKNKMLKMDETRRENGEKLESSKFLKIIAEYKNKIREIKHKIKEEENIP